MDNFGPYDPSLEYSSRPATSEIAPNGRKPPTWKPLRLSRRKFLRWAVCSGTAIAGSAYLVSAPSPLRADARAVERLIRLAVNGRQRTVEAAPNETLAFTLRNL